MDKHVEMLGILDNLIPFGQNWQAKKGSSLIFVLPNCHPNHAKHAIWHHPPDAII